MHSCSRLGQFFAKNKTSPFGVLITFIDRYRTTRVNKLRSNEVWFSMPLSSDRVKEDVHLIVHRSYILQNRRENTLVVQNSVTMVGTWRFNLKIQAIIIVTVLKPFQRKPMQHRVFSSSLLYLFSLICYLKCSTSVWLRTRYPTGSWSITSNAQKLSCLSDKGLLIPQVYGQAHCYYAFCGYPGNVAKHTRFGYAVYFRHAFALEKCRRNFKYHSSDMDWSWLIYLKPSYSLGYFYFMFVFLFQCTDITVRYCFIQKF